VFREEMRAETWVIYETGITKVTRKQTIIIFGKPYRHTLKN
jgi:hypothetical protein